MFHTGQTAYLKDCSPGYQAKNSIVINHIRETTHQVIIDSVKTQIICHAASENGYSWYPFETITDRLEPPAPDTMPGNEV